MPPLRRFARRQLVTHRARARQVRNVGGVHLELLHTAVLLFDAHVQLAGNGVVDVLNAERPRRHLRFIQHAPLLADHHLGVGFRHAGHFRRIAAQVGRQHAVVGSQTDAGKAQAVENVGVQVILPHRQPRTQRRDRPIGVIAAPVELFVSRLRRSGLVVEVGLPVGAQAPGAQVGAAGAVAAQAVAAAAFLVLLRLGVDVIVKQQPGNTVIPARRRIPVFRAVLQIGLWDVEIQRGTGEIAARFHPRQTGGVKAAAAVCPVQRA
ncbi:Uncharacterised protein [Acinetobacter baumannii]|nr:Uncharacterised protein [Acinetobacter baumannii]